MNAARPRGGGPLIFLARIFSWRGAASFLCTLLLTGVFASEGRAQALVAGMSVRPIQPLRFPLEFPESGSPTATFGGRTGTYEVRLTSRPTGPVTVTTGVASTGVVTVEPRTLSFSNMSADSNAWNKWQSVTVRGVDDAIDDDSSRMTTITHEARGGGYNGITASPVTVRTTDDDTKGGTLSTDTLTVKEIGTGTYTARLNSQPTGNVMITPSISATDAGVAAVTVPDGTNGMSQTALIFTPTNWMIPQTVTVTGKRVSSGTEDTIRITHSASGGGYAGVTLGPVTVTIAGAGSTVSPTTLMIDEGSTASYTLTLERTPDTNRLVRVLATSPDRARVLLSASGSSPSDSVTLTFSPGDTEKVVTVHGVDNNEDNPDRTVTITHAVTPTDDYHGPTPADVNVTVRDNERRIVLSKNGVILPNNIQLAVDGTRVQTYNVRLDTPPPAGETVTITINQPGDLRVHPRELTFTDSNWSDNQGVTVTRTTNTSSTRLALLHSASGGGYDNIQRGLNLFRTRSSTQDMGNQGNLCVRKTRPRTLRYNLCFEPYDITLLSGSIRRGGLEFTPDNWWIEQTVYVDQAYTSVRIDNITDTIPNRASGANYGDLGINANVQVTFTENDLARVGLSKQRPTDGAGFLNLVQRPTGQTGDILGVEALDVPLDISFDVTEGDTVTYFAGLASRPANSVTITPDRSSLTLGTVTPDSVVFTRGRDNWKGKEPPRMFTVTIPDDDVDQGPDRTVVIHHRTTSGDSNFNNLPRESVGSVTLRVADNDTAGVTLTPVTPSTLTEGGGDATYTR